MNKTLLIFGAIPLLALSAPQTHCPVMGQKINPKHYADVLGVRIYVYCKPCIAKVKANPKVYLERMKEAGVEPERRPTS